MQWSPGKLLFPWPAHALPVFLCIMLLALRLNGSISRLTACLVLSCLAWLCLALPCLALPCLALPCLALPCLILAFQGTCGDKEECKSRPKCIPVITTLMLQFCRTDRHAFALAFYFHLYLCLGCLYAPSPFYIEPWYHLPQLVWAILRVEGSALHSHLRCLNHRLAHTPHPCYTGSSATYRGVP